MNGKFQRATLQSEIWLAVTGLAVGVAGCERSHKPEPHAAPPRLNVERLIAPQKPPLARIPPVIN